MEINDVWYSIKDSRANQKLQRGRLHKHIAIQHDKWVLEENRKKQMERLATRKIWKSPK